MREGAAVIVGATSMVARALATRLAAAGRPLVLAARDADELRAVAADLRLRHGVPVTEVRLEVGDFAGHGAALDACFAAPVAAVILAAGDMDDPVPAGAEAARRTVEVNFTAAALLLEGAAARLEAQGGGVLCALGSVAGDRGRRGNYLYGAAKGALAVFLQGLRHRLAGTQVRVVTVKLGVVDTRMSFGRPGAGLAVSPEAAARGIERALHGGREVVYVPARWRWIMAVIRALPEPVFKRLRI